MGYTEFLFIFEDAGYHKVLVDVKDFVFNDNDVRDAAKSYCAKCDNSTSFFNSPQLKCPFCRGDTKPIWHINLLVCPVDSDLCQFDLFLESRPYNKLFGENGQIDCLQFVHEPEKSFMELNNPRPYDIDCRPHNFFDGMEPTNLY